MLRTLPESRRPRRRRPGSTLLSVVVHTAVIGAAIAGTASSSPPAAGRAATPPRIIYVPVPPADRPASTRSKSQPNPVTSPVSSIPMPRIEWRAPDPELVPLPPIELSHSWEESRGGDGDGEPTVGNGQISSGAGSGTGAVYEARSVDRIAALQGRIAPPRYPELLRRSAVSGRVVIRFVVDTAGRVEASSIVVTESAHDLFAAAAVATVRALRFTPAQVDGGAVRMMMELPFQFAVR